MEPMLEELLAENAEKLGQRFARLALTLLTNQELGLEASLLKADTESFFKVLALHEQNTKVS